MYKFCMRVMYIKFKDILSNFGPEELVQSLLDFKDFYVRVESFPNKKSKHSIYDSAGIDGKEVPFYFEYLTRGHKIRCDSLEKFLNLENILEDFDYIINLAKQSNKIILGLNCVKNGRRHWDVRCELCGSECVQNQRYFSKCLKCYRNKQGNSHKDFILKANDRHNGRYGYDGVRYKNSREKVDIYCKKCKIYFSQRPCDHIYGSGCPRCCESKGERAVRKYLEKLGLIYEDQKIFSDLVYRGILKYDFCVNYYGSPLLIEYDGEHHFGPIVYNGNIEDSLVNYENLKIRDKLKNEYARKNNIPLLRIPYSDFDKIEELIDAFILEHTRKEIKQLVLEI